MIDVVEVYLAECYFGGLFVLFYLNFLLFNCTYARHEV